jgi:RND superfamily putative drug exporter
MASLTRWVLAHKRIVVIFWVALTLVGMASAGSATQALKQKFSVPGREGWVANQQIVREFRGTGGNTAPLLPVVTLPVGRTVTSPGARAALADLEARVRRILPGSRVAGYASTGSRAFISAGGRTTFAVAYPPSTPRSRSATTPTPRTGSTRS